MDNINIDKLIEILSKKSAESILTDYTLFLTAYIRMIGDPKYKLGEYRLINSSASTDDQQYLQPSGVLTAYEDALVYAFFLAMQQSYRGIGIAIGRPFSVAECVSTKRKVNRVLSDMFGFDLIERTSGTTYFGIGTSNIHIASTGNINAFRGATLSHLLIVGEIDNEAFGCIYPPVAGCDGTIIHVGVAR